MSTHDRGPSRRTVLRGLGALAAASVLPQPGRATDTTLITKPIPSTGERIPVIGMGTSRTFDVPPGAGRDGLLLVLQTFFDLGGELVDSSPMYGAAEEVLGELLDRTGRGNLFAATKVWTDGRTAGIEQMERSRRLWGVERFDLMQIHNLRDWEAHLPTLERMKADGEVRYIGVTTSHGRDHGELAALLRRHRFDFVQLSYNIGNREVEDELLPLAADRGVAVLVNRPFQRGALFDMVRGRQLPGWAGELGIATWGQLFLTFAVSHPAVTCAIPATSKVTHMADNMGAAYGPLPDADQRRRMIRELAEL